MKNQPAFPSGDDIRRRCDDLVEAGLVCLDSPQSLVHIDKGAKFEFRVASSFLKKPALGDAAPGSAACEPGSDINYVHCQIAPVFDKHILAANKFSFTRHALVLVTKDGFRRQWEPLDSHDMAAISTVLAAMSSSSNSSSSEPPYSSSSSVAPSHGGETHGRGGGDSSKDDSLGRRRANDWVGFFNCGVAGGCSRLHKHLQAIPYPDGVTLWPDDADFEYPFHIFRRNIGYQLASADELLAAYRSLLAEATTVWKKYQQQAGDRVWDEWGGPAVLEEGHAIPHNMLLTRSWLAVIPRVRGRASGVPANSLPMVGLLPVGNMDELEGWTRQGPMDILMEMGIPK